MNCVDGGDDSWAGWTEDEWGAEADVAGVVFDAFDFDEEMANVVGSVKSKMTASCATVARSRLSTMISIT